MKCPPAEGNLKYETTRNHYVTVSFPSSSARVIQQVVLSDMASCEYGQIAGGTCGCSVDNPANVKSAVIAKCTKDIRGHLRSQNVRDASVRSESTLLLARAGTYVADLTVLTG